MKFLVITKTPSRQGLLGPIPEKYTVEEVEADNLEMLKDSLKVPLGGKCLVAEKDNVMTVTSRIINEVSGQEPR
jgi:hypothetical protein